MELGLKPPTPFVQWKYWEKIRQTFQIYTYPLLNVLREVVDTHLICQIKIMIKCLKSLKTTALPSKMKALIYMPFCKEFNQEKVLLPIILHCRGKI